MLWEFTFKCEEQSHDFDTKKSTIDIISKEQEFVCGDVAEMFENVKQIVELAMDIADDLYWGVEGQDVGLVVWIGN